MGTGIAATGTEREWDSVLRERDGSGTQLNGSGTGPGQMFAGTGRERY